MTHDLRTEQVSLGYGGEDIVKQLDVAIPAGRVSVIVGGNGCGKSTLLRGLVRLLKPTGGQVVLNGESLHAIRSNEVAKIVGLLPQAPVAPEGITVFDLVGRGRYPHQGWFRQWTADDDRAVEEALASTATAELADRQLAELSGGQRQRVWVAMALAQETDVLLLDEPTTYLDIQHQIDLLDLMTDLNRHSSRTIVMVLHDLNLACRYADHLIAMKAGRIVAEGAPGEVVTPALVHEVFGLTSEVVPDPVSGTPLVVPRGRHHAAS